MAHLFELTLGFAARCRQIGCVDGLSECGGSSVINHHRIVPCRHVSLLDSVECHLLDCASLESVFFEAHRRGLNCRKRA